MSAVTIGTATPETHDTGNPQKRSTLRHANPLISLLVLTLLAGVLCVFTGPAVAQDSGEIDLVIEPANATVAPGEVQTYELSVVGPDNGISVYGDIFVEIDDPSVGNITAFTEQHDSNLSNSEIQDGGETLVLDAFVPNSFTGPAESITLAEFTVAATAGSGNDTALSLNESADPTVVDDDNEAYNTSALADGGLSISDPANFAVTLTNVDEQVTAGETATVEYEVENTGGLEATQDIEFAINGTVEATAENVSLAGGETLEETFSYDTAAGDVPAISVSVSSADEQVTETVAVLDPALFEVDITGTNSPVIDGETLSVTALVENTGDVDATQTVELAAGALGNDSTNLTLGGGDSVNQTLSVVTEGGQTGQYTATVATANDSDERNVSILADAQFAVSIAGTSSPVAAGETLTVNTTTANSGDVEATQQLTLSAGSLGTDSINVTLDGGESTTQELSVTTGGDDAGEYTVTVASADESDSTTATILEPAALDLSGLDIAGQGTTAVVVPNETMSVSVSVTNIGNATGTFNISLTIGNDIEATTSTGAIDPGETETVSFEGVTGNVDAGNYTVSVAAGEDTIEGTLVVQPDVNGDGQPATDTTGDGLLNDVDGDAEFDIFDVQALFTNLNSETVQSYPAAFNFNENENPEEVGIFDVQGLFQLL